MGSSKNSENDGVDLEILTLRKWNFQNKMKKE